MCQRDGVVVVNHGDHAMDTVRHNANAGQLERRDTVHLYVHTYVHENG